MVLLPNLSLRQPLHTYWLWMKLLAQSRGRNLAPRVQFGYGDSSDYWETSSVPLEVWSGHSNWISRPILLAPSGPEHNMTHFIYFCDFMVPESQQHSSKGKLNIFFQRVPIDRNSEWSWHKSNERKALYSSPSNPRSNGIWKIVF